MHQNGKALLFFTVAWLVACSASSVLVMSRDFQPGPVGPSLSTWPAETALVRSDQKTTVAVFLHPKCMCTRATVTQLMRTLETHPQVNVQVVIFVPPNQIGAERKEWEESKYVNLLRTAVPPISIVFDPGGKEAQRFGALTSGTVLVYNSQGHEIFRGGITNRRGGEENNPGLQRFARVLAGGEALQDPVRSSPVFGCALVSSKKGKEMARP